jgi:hypothetical protein
VEPLAGKRVVCVECHLLRIGIEHQERHGALRHRCLHHHSGPQIELVGDLLPVHGDHLRLVVLAVAVLWLDGDGPLVADAESHYAILEARDELARADGELDRVAIPG